MDVVAEAGEEETAVEGAAVGEGTGAAAAAGEEETGAEGVAGEEMGAGGMAEATTPTIPTIPLARTTPTTRSAEGRLICFESVTA